MKIAYLVNQYPKISHVFIRREILAVEKEGCEVERYSIRRSSDVLIDTLDVEEAKKTHVVLDAGWSFWFRSIVRLLLLRPRRFFGALHCALRMGKRSERGTLRHLVYLAEACVLVAWFGRDGIHHVHAHFGTNSTTVAALCRELGGPSFSFTAHGPEEFDKALLLALDQKIARASFVAGISSYGRSQLYRRCSHAHWPKVKIVRCGVDQAFLGPAPAPLGSRRLLSVGRLCEQKGQMLLVEAAARLRAEGLSFELMLIGDGALRADIEAAIARHALASTVRIVGWADSATIRDALDGACAFVLPSFAEGLPVVIMEAMARARPVVSTFVAGIPELVVPGRNGWLVPAGSIDDLVDTLRTVLSTPHERLAEMGNRAREDVARLHAVEKSARELKGLFDKVVAGSAP